MRTIKFAGHTEAQVKIVVYDCGAQSLVSYSTPVVYVDENGWLQINGLYSMTTRKHISWFMKSLGFDYSVAKILFANHERMNIRTGEVLPLED